jgi:hypothetical protein
MNKHIGETCNGKKKLGCHLYLPFTIIRL